MPELTFDEFGLPVWTNNALSADRSGTDPDPLGEAMAAINAIGAQGGIPLPEARPEFSPGALPVGAPPEQVPGNALMNPDGSWDHPSPDAVQLPAPGFAEPVAETGLPLANYQQSMSGPAPEPVGAAPAAVQAKSKRPSDPVAAAQYDETMAQQSAADAAYAQAVAENEARSALVDRRATAAERAAGEQAKVDAQYQQLRDRAMADSDRETAQWMMQMEEAAKKEPNPSRWFHSKSTAGKALFLLSLAFGTKAAASAPGVQNIGLAMWKEEMDRDLGEQRARMQREMEVLRMKGTLIDKRTAQRLATMRDDHSIRTGQLLALEKAALERANAPGSEDDRAAMAAAHSWLAQQRMATAAQRAQEAYQKREAAIARAHSAAQAQKAREWQAGQAALDRQFELDKLGLQATAKYETDLAKLRGDFESFDPKFTGLGVVQRDSAGKPVYGEDGKVQIKDLTLPKDKYADINKISQPSHAVTNELITIRDALRDGTFLKRVVGGDPVLNRAITRGAYAEAKKNDPRGIVTNADFDNGMKSLVGFDLSTTTGRALAEAKIAAFGDDFVTQIDQEIRNIEAKTTQELNAAVPKQYGGGNIVWRARSQKAQEPVAETFDESKERVTGVEAAKVVPGDIADLKRARAEGTLVDYKTIKTPALGYDSGTSTETIVREAKVKFKGLAPEQIDQFAPGYTEAVKGDKRAELEIDEAYGTSRKNAAEAEEAVKAVLQARAMHQGIPVTRDEVVTQLKRAGLEDAAKEPAYVKKVVDAVHAVLRGEGN